MNSPRNDHEIHALSGAYAVDALDDAGRARFEEHLAACAECRAEVDEPPGGRRPPGGLATAAPPAALRDGVLADITRVRPLPPRPAEPARRPGAARPRRRRARPHAGALLAAAAAVLAVVGVGAVGLGAGRPDRGTVPACPPVERVLRAPDAQRVDVTLPGGVSASVIRSGAEGKAVLVTRNMPAAPAGRVYELWLQTPGG